MRAVVEYIWSVLPPCRCLLFNVVSARCTTAKRKGVEEKFCSYLLTQGVKTCEQTDYHTHFSTGPLCTAHTCGTIFSTFTVAQVL